MSRYLKYHYLTQVFFSSKAPFYHPSSFSNLSSLTISGGHFKLNSLHTEHGLIFRILSGQNPTLRFYTHGKRLKKTVLMTTHVSRSNLWSTLDKFINVAVPSVEDLQTLKFRRSRKVHDYVWRLNKYFDWSEISLFISDRLLKYSVFLPIFLNFKLSTRFKTSVWTEAYLRMLRCPFSFYRTNLPFAPDDSASY